MYKQRISSALSSIKIRQVPSPMIIGERLNTQGSRKAKRLVMENDYEGLLDLAREQVEDGAHCLDVCVATTERDDEKEFMCNLVKHLCFTVDAPLVIDSTDPKVIEASLEQIPALPMINSINLEGDGSRFREIAPLMAKYGAPAIAMCIGPNGMAKTPEEKLQVARMMIQEGEKYKLEKHQFIFDVLTFTLATGENEFRKAGKNTLDGIRMVHENIPESYTVLGLSNISFGLEKQARMVINSVFLHHAVKAGVFAMPLGPIHIAMAGAPYFAMSGAISLKREPSPSRFIEFIMGSAGICSSEASITFGSVESITRGASTVKQRCFTRLHMNSFSSSRSVVATHTSRQWAPSSTCSLARSNRPS